MPQLKNRHSGVSYVTQFGQFVPANTFGQTKEVAANKETIQLILKDIQKRLPPNLSSAEKVKFLRVIRKELDSQEFAVLLNSEEVMQSVHALMDQAQKLDRKTTEDEYSITSFVKTLGTSLISSVMSSNFPIGMLALSALPAVAAQMNATTAAVPAPWQIHEGMPEGGQDLCTSVLLYGCLQGFLTRGSESWTLGDPQFSRIISNVKGEDSPLGSTYATLRNCLSTDVVGKVVENVIKTSEGQVSTISCVSTSTPWDDYQVTGQAVGLAKHDCIAFQNTFNTAVLNCQDAWARAGRNAAIAGGTIGGVCLCVCVIGLAFYCCNNNDKECTPPCCV